MFLRTLELRITILFVEDDILTKSPSSIIMKNCFYHLCKVLGH